MKPAPPPASVVAVPVARENLALFIEAVATIDGFVNADIRARVKGYVRGQHYKDGATVKQGQLLFSIEPDEYANAVAAARAALVRAEAAKKNGTIELNRNQLLSQQGLVATQVFDKAVATAGDAEGQVLAARAALQQAELNLSYTQIHAPVAGVAGLALVRAGNLVGQDGPTLLTTVSQVDPIRVNFPMSEIDYVRFPERLKHLEQRDVAWARQQFARLDAQHGAGSGDPGLELVLADGSVYTHRGVLVAANRQVDASTGTIQLQALFANPEGALKPGQYGRVRIPREDQGQAALVVPEKALIATQGSFSLGVVGRDRRVHLRQVEVGPATRGMRIVTKGVSEGDQVVVEGLQKISEGSLVALLPARSAS
ncbi:MAG TPA: efflux RND transporter periplasmic adaptor subunit [Polyangiaceae bacterium]|nr:efflux RND transporter periplasmic adaptor subunit [Polyangiaceae bacterium]